MLTYVSSLIYFYGRRIPFTIQCLFNLFSNLGGLLSHNIFVSQIMHHIQLFQDRLDILFHTRSQRENMFFDIFYRLSRHECTIIFLILKELYIQITDQLHHYCL